jgi:tetratricopeptide (TPR) repeat protein
LPGGGGCRGKTQEQHRNLSDVSNPVIKQPATWLLLAICALTVCVYYPGLSGDYMFDDTGNLLKNKSLEIESLDLDSLGKAAFSARSGVLRRPVSMASFALNRYFFGIHPFSHKVINLGIHLATGLLLFLLARMLVQYYRQHHNRELPARVAFWLPLVATGLWLVHPLNLTSVLYIVQRMTSLSALFTVAGLCLYVIGRRRMLAGRHGMSWLLAGLFGCGGLAILSKETGVLLPLYMLVIEITLFRFSNDRGQTDRAVAVFFTLFLLLPAMLACLYLALRPEQLINYTMRDFTLTERLLTQPRVILFYLKMIVMPSVRELGLYHDDIRISLGLMDPPATLYALLALAALLATGAGLRLRAPLVSLGILWFFAGHALESTIFPLEMAHEHRNYLADFGILLAVSAALAQAPLQRLRPLTHTVLPLLMLLLFSYTTWSRSTQWADNVDHAIHEARHHPESPRAVFSAGRIHARLALNGRQQSEAAAFDYLARAAELDSAGIMPEITMIKLGYLLGKPVSQQLFDDVYEKLANYPLSPSDITSLQELADCSGERCQVPVETMERIFSAALESENSRIIAVYGFYTINKRGNFPKGLELFNRAVEISPGEPQYWKNLINLLIVMARFDEAEQRLGQFKALGLVGSSESDYRTLQEEIDRIRVERRRSGDTDTGNS